MYKRLILFGFIIFLQSCNSQTTARKEIYNKEFNWTIAIPENFESVNNADWAKVQNKGADAIERTYDEEVINQAKIIFVFKKNQFNYFESNYQPFDLSVDGDYIESCKAVDEILYQTFKAQMPGVKIHKERSVENIDNLEFQKLTMRVEYPNKMVLNTIMYSRLFGKKDFSVNIIYVDKLLGEKMLEAWKQSKFSN